MSAPASVKISHGGPSLRKRLLSIFLIALAVVLFTGYFAFRTFMFDPLEDDFEGDLAALIPRDVDFYLAKNGLSEDFARFPPKSAGEGLVTALAAGPELLATKGVQTFLESPQYRELERQLDLEQRLQRLDDALAKLPVSLDVLKTFGGRGLACAGYLRGQSLAQADWAVYGRVNWMGKLAQSLLRYPGLLKLEQQGLRVENAGGVLSLSGGGLTRTLHLLRLRDVLVISTERKLAEKVLDLDLHKGQDSFGQSARYADHIQRKQVSQRELELYADTRTLVEKLGLTKAWPNTASQDLVTGFLGRLFQFSNTKEIEGVVDLQGGIGFDLHADLSSEQMTAVMRRIYRARTFDKKEIDDVARMVPADAALMVYLHSNLGDLLRSAFDAWEPAGRTNFNDMVRSVWGYSDANKLFEELDAALDNKLLLIARPLDYPDEGENGPWHDDKPDWAWAVVGWMHDTAKVNELHRKVENNPGLFGIQGRKPGDPGVFTNTVQGGQVVYEFWQRMVPATGHISTVRTGDGYFMVGNHNQMIAQVLQTLRLLESRGRYASLKDAPEFSSLVELGLDHASLLVYVNPRQGTPVLRRKLARAAEDSLVPDWKNVERPRIEKLVAKQSFNGTAPPESNPDERQRFNELVEAECARFLAEFNVAHLPPLLQAIDRIITWSEMARAVLVELALNEKSIELKARAIVPLGKVGE